MEVGHEEREDGQPQPVVPPEQPRQEWELHGSRHQHGQNDVADDAQLVRPDRPERRDEDEGEGVPT